MLKFPIFAQSVQKCDDVLRPRGIDIYNILTNKDKSVFDNILNSFVGIAAVQVSLMFKCNIAKIIIITTHCGFMVIVKVLSLHYYTFVITFVITKITIVKGL